MKLSEHVAEDSAESHPMFKCSYVIIPGPLKKGLGMHIQMKHRISQPDGIDDSCVGDSKEDDTVNLELGEYLVFPSNTLPHSKVVHSKAGIGLKEKEHSMT